MGTIQTTMKNKSEKKMAFARAENRKRTVEIDNIGRHLCIVDVRVYLTQGRWTLSWPSSMPTMRYTT